MCNESYMTEPMEDDCGHDFEQWWQEVGQFQQQQPEEKSDEPAEPV